MSFIKPGWFDLLKRLAHLTGIRRPDPWHKLNWAVSELPAKSRKVDVLFSAKHYYQVKELASVNLELTRMGVKTGFLDHSLKGDSPAADEARLVGFAISSLHDYSAGRIRPAALVVRTDADQGSRKLLCHGNKSGIITAALAHSLINFRRKPNQYQLPHHIFCAGHYTARRLKREGIEITGFPYFDQFLQQPEKLEETDLVIVNVALPRGLVHAVPEIDTYRKNWVNEVLQASRTLGLNALVSVHPRDTSPHFDWPVKLEPIEQFLPNAAVVVSPPSTVIFTAMALGTPVACHQCPPVRQQMPGAFDEPRGAFRISEDLNELTKSIEEAVTWQSDYRKTSKEFFSRHISVIPERSMTERTALAIMRLINK